MCLNFLSNNWIITKFSHFWVAIFKETSGSTRSPIIGATLHPWLSAKLKSEYFSKLNVISGNKPPPEEGRRFVPGREKVYAGRAVGVPLLVSKTSWPPPSVPINSPFPLSFQELSFILHPPLYIYIFALRFFESRTVFFCNESLLPFLFLWTFFTVWVLFFFIPSDKNFECSNS